MNQFTTITLSCSDGVATITLNRPERLNAWTPLMGREVSSALAQCDADDQVRAVIITGAGRSFCAGADLDPKNAESVEDLRAQSPLEATGPPQVRKPVIAAINGDAVGVGLTYPLQCDVRFVAEDAKLGFVFVRRGLLPEAGIHWTLPRAIGVHRAAELLLSGRIFSGRDALEMGLVNEALPSSEVLDAASQFAADIARNTAPVSVAIAKRLLWDSLTGTLARTQVAESELFWWTVAQPDAMEGVRAFLEKREPRWTMSTARDMPEWDSIDGVTRSSI